MLILAIALAAISFSHAKDASDPERMARDCEILLAGTGYDRKPTLEEFETYLVLLEGHVHFLESLPHPHASELRAGLNSLYDELLSGQVGTGYKTRLRHFVQTLAQWGDPVTPEVRNPSVGGLLESHDTLVAGQMYEVSGAEFSHVVFRDSVVKDLLRYDVHFLERVYRAIAKGFVRRENASGIKRLSRVDAHLVELKIHPTSYRLFGCLDKGVLTFKGVARKSNSTFSYAAYADFCK